MLLTSHLEHELTVDDLPDETQVAGLACLEGGGGGGFDLKEIITFSTYRYPIRNDKHTIYAVYRNQL
jgi:hypothetical protein